MLLLSRTEWPYFLHDGVHVETQEVPPESVRGLEMARLPLVTLSL